MKSFIFFIVYLCTLSLMSAEGGSVSGSGDFPYHKVEMPKKLKLLEPYVFGCALQEAFPAFQKMFNNVDLSDKNAHPMIALGGVEEAEEVENDLNLKWFVIISDISDKNSFKQKLFCPESKSSYRVYQVTLTDEFGKKSLPWMLPCGRFSLYNDMRAGIEEAVISICAAANGKKNFALCLRNDERFSTL
ncbi:MAG: hypothetical protein OXC30_05600 [Alphaproteobacteria bacterium]|nr:hypothetical protein [Alphaproteobacteria bacterium]